MKLGRGLAWPIFLTAAGVALLILTIFLACGCGSKPIPVKQPEPVIAPPITVITTRIDCLTKPPPLEPESFGFVDEHCPADMGGCITEEALRALIIYISDLQKYTNNAWTQCGPTPTKEKTP